MRYFVSDFHIGSKERAESGFIREFNVFCTSLSSGDELCILGDFFDFWIEYKNFVRSDFVEVYSILQNAVQNGINVYMVRGNHDFMRGDFLKKLGIKVFDNSVEFKVCNKKILCIHGDGISGDFWYSVLKFILRNGFFQFSYKLLPPFFTVWFAEIFSGLSRKKNKKNVKSANRKEKYRKYALKFTEKYGSDVLIMGHSHIFDLYKTSGKIYANCGVWFEKSTYILLQENKLFLKEFCGNLENDVILEETEI
jgi:UDP-2,3-diacylglucosamine hydrolase